MNKQLAWIFAILILLTASTAATVQDTTDTEAKFNQFYALTQQAFGLPQRTQIEKIQAGYRLIFDRTTAPINLSSADDADLPFIYRAAELVEFYVGNSSYLDDMRGTLQELERRKIATDDQRASFYRALIGLRRFKTAGDYLATHPSLQVEPVPKIGLLNQDLKRPVVYAVADGGRSLQPRYVDIDQGINLIVVSHPLCAFSRRAMEALAVEEELRPVLQHVIWLAPVDQRLYLDVVSAWNREHPTTPIVLARHRSDWPMFEDWATPHFYLLRDGKLVGDFAGWPREGNREQLVQLLTKGGLLSAKGNSTL